MCLPLARLRPDVVQFEWNVAAVDHLPLFGVWRCPVVTSCRGGLDITVSPHVPHMRPFAERLPDVMRQAAAVHCVSERMVRDAGDFGLDASKAHVIRPAVDPAAFAPQSPNGRPDPDTLRALMVGRLRWEKGYEYALEAVRRVVDRGVRVQLELVGEQPGGVLTSRERARIMHTVADLGLEAHVTLRGAMTPEGVSRRLAGSDVLLHTSLAEGIPNVVLEAMACGVPVVATDVDGTSEALTDGVEGFLVGPRDPDGLAKALLRLAGDASLRDRMGAAGRERIEGGWTLDAQLDAFLDMYREVAA
jgi:glycosyltransferase involved in cell wall biosynthesis